jgi:2-polyprenyl-6-methoxyphenol hydroxylase-like FAD-dependent oxidoreductase
MLMTASTDDSAEADRLVTANRAIYERVRAAGYDYPLLSIHSGKLQGALYEATRVRIGEDHIHTAHQLHDVAQDEHDVTATFIRRDGSDEIVTTRGDVLIAADGIHSTVLRIFYPDAGAPTWNGIMLWRGAVEHPQFLVGHSMIIAGGMQAKLVLCSISNQSSTPGTTLLNWAVAAKLGDGSTPPPRREDWRRLGRLEELLPHVEGVFQLATVDPVEIIRATPAFYEYPMCDCDLLPHWSFGRVMLLGDAAHPMYPVGSNGASQAILDARCVAPLLAETKDVVTALKAYEAARLSVTAKIVQDNRSGPPERGIDMVEERASHGFANLDEVASHDELEAIVKGYSKMAGFDQTQVNC